MSGYPEVGEHPMSLASTSTDPNTVALAESAIARRARDENWSRDHLVDMLEHLGLRPPAKPTPGHVNPVGKNVSPEAQQARRERKAASRRAARAAAKEGETS